MVKGPLNILKKPSQQLNKKTINFELLNNIMDQNVNLGELFYSLNKDNL
jgi:hypothetical protein